jgi:hypothetical protein
VVHCLSLVHWSVPEAGSEKLVATEDGSIGWNESKQNQKQDLETKIHGHLPKSISYHIQRNKALCITDCN